ncbi:hypothetical protein PoB_001827800 [Plakobranchus ocellatus]|uniref:Uncharacterized protein n=1 Tax=Plakobranchus ocellatus TaxID=259542 RepID=A0AAV3ZAJ2_9GAST|nr:hypothetical protein PoB_001827800 [Plakobranchus ocellatus]
MFVQPVHNKVISSFRHCAITQKRPYFGLNLGEKCFSRYQGGFAIHCATNAPEAGQVVIFVYRQSTIGDLRVSGPLLGQGRGSNPRQKGPCRSQGGLASHCTTHAGQKEGRSAVGGSRIHDRRVNADLRTDSLATEPSTPQVAAKETLLKPITILGVIAVQSFHAPRTAVVMK